MNPRLLGALGLGVLLLVALVWAYRARDDAEVAGPRDSTSEILDPAEIDEADLVPVELYFPDQEGTLTIEERLVPPTASPESRARVVLQAVLDGPTGGGLARPFPETLTLGVTYLSPGAVLYVDLESADDAEPIVTGSLGELLAVYSLVNSVLLDTERIEAIVLLRDGQQPKTFAGHVDTSLPIGPDPDLIRAGN